MEGFEWDEFNKSKSWIKHGVSWKECEEVFENLPLIIYNDTKHSDREERFIALGKTAMKRKLHVVFTKRDDLIRVISGRDQNKKERRFYATQEN